MRCNDRMTVVSTTKLFIENSLNFIVNRHSLRHVLAATQSNLLNLRRDTPHTEFS